MHWDGGEPKNRQTVTQEHSYILIRVVNNSPRQLISMLIVGAFTASSGSRTMRFAASLGRSNSLRHALSVLLTSAPGFASPRGLEDRDRESQSLIRGNVLSPPSHPAYVSHRFYVGSPPLSPTCSISRRIVARRDMDQQGFGEKRNF